jgi:hypothetical protein
MMSAGDEALALARENVMAKRDNGAFRRLRIKESDDLKAIYARVKKSFTAADLQRYTEVGQGIPAEQLVAELESIHKQELRKMKKRPRRR